MDLQTKTEETSSEFILTPLDPLEDQTINGSGQKYVGCGQVQLPQGSKLQRIPNRWASHRLYVAPSLATTMDLYWQTEAAATRALALDGADMGGFYLKVQPYKASRIQKTDFTPEIVDGYNRIYAGNLSWDVTEDDLRNLFSDCKISSIRFGMDKETGEFKGYAHVDFDDSISLTIALKLDQKVVCGRPVRIRCAVPKKEAETKSSSKSAAGRRDFKVAKRSCYECGVTGHLASACPRKRTVELDGSQAAETTLSAEPAVKKEEDSTNVGNPKKKKRRTCYECGVPGHLSSDCPRKRVGEVGGSGGDR